MTEAPPFVSVIVPAYDAEGLLETCLDALGAQTYPQDRFEVLIADNGVRPGGDKDFIRRTIEARRADGRQANVRRIDAPEPGSYNARNRALKAAKGEVLAFTDVDCVPGPDWLSEGVRALQAEPGAGVLAGEIVLFDTGGEGGDRACALYERAFSFRQKDNLERTGAVATANWMSPRAAFDQVGEFNGALKSQGDAEMARRIRDAGWRCVYVPGMVVRHPMRTALADTIAKRRRVSGGLWQREGRKKGAGRLVLTLAKNAWSKSGRALADPALPASDRALLAGTVMLLGVVEIGEILRLRLGGEPQR